MVSAEKILEAYVSVSVSVLSVSSQGPERCVSFPNGVVRVLGFNLQSSGITISVLNHRLLCNPVLLFFLFFFFSFYFLILRQSHVSQTSLNLTSRRWSVLLIILPPLSQWFSAPLGFAHQIPCVPGNNILIP